MGSGHWSDQQAERLSHAAVTAAMHWAGCRCTSGCYDTRLDVGMLAQQAELPLACSMQSAAAIEALGAVLSPSVHGCDVNVVHCAGQGPPPHHHHHDHTTHIKRICLTPQQLREQPHEVDMPRPRPGASIHPAPACGRSTVAYTWNHQHRQQPGRSHASASRFTPRSNRAAGNCRTLGGGRAQPAGRRKANAHMTCTHVYVCVCRCGSDGPQHSNASITARHAARLRPAPAPTGPHRTARRRHRPCGGLLRLRLHGRRPA